MSAERARSCETCGVPLAPGQRYCIACGTRQGAPSPLLTELLRRVTRSATANGDDAAGSPSGEPPAQPPSSAAARAPALALPSPRISALLVLVFLGFGVLLGSAASPHVTDTLAASRQHIKVVLAPQSAVAGAPAPSPASSSSSSSSSSSNEPPLPEATPTPTPAASSTPQPGPASAPKPSSSSGNSSAGKGAGGETSGGGGTPQAPAAGAEPKLPPIKHVFVVMLSDQPYAAVFGPASAVPYVSETLERQGELLAHYDAVAHEDLANEVALVSGQGPTAETEANCPNYAEIEPASTGADEQALGSGCVYPASTQTLGGELSAKRLSWRAYIEGMDEAGAPTGACGHPALGQPDPTVGAAGVGAYATFLNPFVYFDSVTGSAACAEDDVGLDELESDLADPSHTPSFSYIAPDRCHDANPTPCAPGATAGLAPAGEFLQKVVPEIVRSKAYKDGGLLVITVDDAPSSGEFADSSSCCGQPLFPNIVPSTTSTGLSPRGGGAVGALLLSPFIKGASTSQEPYNHFSLLRTIEDLFDLRHLGYAALPGVKPFEASMFTAR